MKIHFFPIWFVTIFLVYPAMTFADRPGVLVKGKNFSELNQMYLEMLALSEELSRSLVALEATKKAERETAEHLKQRLKSLVEKYSNECSHTKGHSKKTLACIQLRGNIKDIGLELLSINKTIYDHKNHVAEKRADFLNALDVAITIKEEMTTIMPN